MDQFRENEPVIFSIDDTWMVGLLRPLNDYDQEVEPDSVLLDEIDTFRNYVLVISEIHKFTSNRLKEVLKLVELNNLLCKVGEFIYILNEWKLKKRISDDVVFQETHKYRRTKSESPNVGCDKIQFYLRIVNNAKEIEDGKHAAQDFKNFYLGQIVLYYMNKCIFLGRLLGGINGEAVVNDCFLNIRRRISTTVIFNVDTLSKLWPYVDDAKSMEFGKFIHEYCYCSANILHIKIIYLQEEVMTHDKSQTSIQLKHPGNVRDSTPVAMIPERRRPVMDVSKLRGIIWMWNIGCLSTADVAKSVMHDLESPVTWATIHYFEGENVVDQRKLSESLYTIGSRDKEMYLVIHYRVLRNGLRLPRIVNVSSHIIFHLNNCRLFYREWKSIFNGDTVYKNNKKMFRYFDSTCPSSESVEPMSSA